MQGEQLKMPLASWLASRFCIFRAPIPLVSDKVESIVLACCSLHKIKPVPIVPTTPPAGLDSEDPETHLVNPDDWQEESGLQSWQPLAHSNRFSDTAKDIRDHFKDFYISNDGAVLWQWICNIYCECDCMHVTLDPYYSHYPCKIYKLWCALIKQVHCVMTCICIFQCCI